MTFLFYKKFEYEWKGLLEFNKNLSLLTRQEFSLTRVEIFGKLSTVR